MRIIGKKLLGAAAFSLFLVPGGALSFDAQSFLDQQTELAKQQGFELKHEGPLQTLGADGFQVENLSFIGGEMKEPFKIGLMRIEGIEELGNGSYAAKNLLIENLSLNGVSENQDRFEFSLANISAENYLYLSPTDTETSMFHFPSSTYRIGQLTLNINDKPLLVGEGGFGTSITDVANQTMQTNGAFNKFNIDLTAIDDPKFTAQRNELGYDNLTLNFSIAGDWNLATGQMDITDYTIDAEEAGKLQLKASIGGLTTDVIQQFRKISAEAQALGANPDPKKQQLQGMQMMAMMSQLIFQNLSIRYDDRSLADRILGIQAKAMGTTKEELVQLFPSMIPAMTARLGSPELGALLSSAASAFLANPGNLTLSANPIRPLPFVELMTLGSSAPAALVEALNISAKANE